ncbi:MAG: DUF1015 domain-containing protein [Lachnospiraceae bacterium]|nr:DUF1015 domain-containing protein [Lachnospiraceae bacterium]
MNCLHVPRMMMPLEGTDLYKWSVIACDQYTSQPEYWKETEHNVGDAPSTLRLTLPEVYLGEDGEAKRVEDIHRTMEQYLQDGILQELPAGFMLVRRNFGKQCSRWGLVAEIDLETYDYKRDAYSLIRPTEMTVEERIPPRLRVRQTASVELPHIMLMIDDPEGAIIEPLVDRRDEFRRIYGTDLMQEGGYVEGWLVPEGKDTEFVMKQAERLADPAVFRKKYDLDREYPLLNFAVGDGNHSMATAKAAWENIKAGLSEEQRSNHPARFCLCEIVNVHDESIEVEPIHRVVFQADTDELLAEAKTYYEKAGCRMTVKEYNGKDSHGDETEEAHCFTLCSAGGWKTIKVINPKWGIAVATLQSFLDDYLTHHEQSRIDYIHGSDVVESLGTKEGNLGFFLPEIRKEDLFIGVIKDGVLPRKTFSIGEANEKRYYMECKRIRPIDN